MNNKNIDRRNFLKLSTVATSGAVLTGTGLPQQAMAQSLTSMSDNQRTIRLGFIGLGGRGQYHLSSALGIPGVEVPALCEIREDRLNETKKWVEDSGRTTPKLYNRGPDDYKRLCETEKLDAVIISTPWEYHAPMCLSAMRNGKHAVSEVPIILTLDEAWEILETWEKTGKWATIALEQALLESSDGLGVINMIQKGLLGDIIHAEGGYVHDLRLVKFDDEREPWRLQHSVDRNGNLYPDHPMNRILPALGINHGDRIDYLVSMSSKSVMLNEYAASYPGEKSKYANVKMALGDYNATLIRTVDGKMITLNFDTNTPHPREHFRVQGTKGVYFNMAGEPKIYIEGLSPKAHTWESAAKYLEEYEHPLIKNYDPTARIWGSTRGHGGRYNKTPITWDLLIKALRENKMPVWDVYDSLTHSAISPVTEESVANNGRPVKFPDFTKGLWKNRPLLTFES